MPWRQEGTYDRDPVLDEAGRWALRSTKCGHVDYLDWLPEEAGLLLWGEAKRRRELSVGQGRFAA